MIPENGRDVRDNENRVMYNERESVTLLKGDVERPLSDVGFRQNPQGSNTGVRA